MNQYFSTFLISYGIALCLFSNNAIAQSWLQVRLERADRMMAAFTATGVQFQSLPDAKFFHLLSLKCATGNSSSCDFIEHIGQPSGIPIDLNRNVSGAAADGIIATLIDAGVPGLPVGPVTHYDSSIVFCSKNNTDQELRNCFIRVD